MTATPDGNITTPDEDIAERSVRAVVEFMVLCGSAEAFLAEHQRDSYGKCSVCTYYGARNVPFPCIIAFAAQQAHRRTKPRRATPK